MPHFNTLVFPQLEQAGFKRPGTDDTRIEGVTRPGTDDTRIEGGSFVANSLYKEWVFVALYFPAPCTPKVHFTPPCIVPNGSIGL